MNKRQTTGLAGVAALTLGAFAPLMSMPIVGSINYINGGSGDGKFVLAFAVISALAILAKKYVWLWLTGLASLALIGFTFVNVVAKIQEMQASLVGNPFAGLANVQIQWGWAVLVIGAALLLVTASMADDAAVEVSVQTQEV